MLKAEGRDSISRAGRLNPDKCARKLNCPVVLNKNKRGCRLRSNFRQDLANPFGNHVGEREGGTETLSRLPAGPRTRTDMDCETEKKERRKESDPILVKFCARYMSPFSPSPLLKPLCCRRKDRSCQRGWLQIKNLVPLFSHSNFLRWGNPRLHSGRDGGGPDWAGEGIFPTEKRDRPLEPDYSEAARHA